MRIDKYAVMSLQDAGFRSFLRRRGIRQESLDVQMAHEAMALFWDEVKDRACAWELDQTYQERPIAGQRQGLPS